MPHAVASDFRELIAERIKAEHRTLATGWLERLKELLPVDIRDIFPGHALLDHIPALVVEIADYLRAPAEEAIAANTAVLAKAKDLGELRHAQRASVHQVVREYRILRSVIAHFIGEETQRLGLIPRPPDLFDVLNRFDDAIGTLLEATVDTIVAEDMATINRQTARLEDFNRLVSHELRQPLGTAQYAIKLLASNEVLADPAKCERFVTVLERNVARMADMLNKLTTLSQKRTKPMTPRFNGSSCRPSRPTLPDNCAR